MFIFQDFRCFIMHCLRDKLTVSNGITPCSLFKWTISEDGFRPGLIEWVKTLLTNSSRIITCVVFLQLKRNENGRRRSTWKTRGKEVDGQTYTINSQQTEPKFCKNHLRNEAYSRRNQSSLRNQDIIIKTSNYLTSSIITHSNLNQTHENTKFSTLKRGRVENLHLMYVCVCIY